MAGVTAEALHGGTPLFSHGPTGATVQAGGVDYVEERDERLCPVEKSDGTLCTGFKTASGVCVGHRKR